ncbi:hypothetical protein H112_08149 [Trichophyton rubrum D6]|uniref:Uncharacterized protein n=3 Tax=Trichophyton TaxID=5550 RepID=A0A080WDZ7_TRIRC|nr:uncharacterized protein TERG_11619 [Trichophyton rubrum CBS 118892]EZF10570.1 hypothetical protein H100_08176 [Trichophyton rubrum MR850]EZF37429.1 hypothetical protein H102_08133 [Trichophyton rubrum CBS 100081]EZF48056.1 hypothetical protein H103_08159 [Trichophyton rubrum CBS 288.86]EZF58720.1 hypothetical protein H104_08108 [Trichophyton rubrum CBS 289.86]EZF69314.1 hypothetical protein H105_08160 [Trichophyton soudanense CBS 452.61]EZF80036.1 hypothetical protein H110_08162 [Trichophy
MKHNPESKQDSGEPSSPAERGRGTLLFIYSVRSITIQFSLPGHAFSTHTHTHARWNWPSKVINCFFLFIFFPLSSTFVLYFFPETFPFRCLSSAGWEFSMYYVYPRRTCGVQPRSLQSPSLGLRAEQARPPSPYQWANKPACN